MTFDEMQLILQQITLSQRESQRELQEFNEEVRRIVMSNDRTIQAILDQAATDRLRQEEDRLRQEEDRLRHEEQMIQLRHISQGLVNMMSSIDEDRPTILRKLNTIENKTDAIIERLNQN